MEKILYITVDIYNKKIVKIRFRILNLIRSFFQFVFFFSEKYTEFESKLSKNFISENEYNNLIHEIHRRFQVVDDL